MYILYIIIGLTMPRYETSNYLQMKKVVNTNKGFKIQNNQLYCGFCNCFVKYDALHRSDNVAKHKRTFKHTKHMQEPRQPTESVAD